MDRTTLISELRRLDRAGVWLYTRADLRIVFPGEPEQTQAWALARAVEAGDLLRVTTGIYAADWARSKSSRPLDEVVACLRPDDLNYLTAETVLSERGIISQTRHDRIVVMTTGRSGNITTPWGVIELVHTKRDPAQIKPHLKFSPQRNIWVASAELAYADLKRMRRNLDLVDLDELAEAIEEDAAEFVSATRETPSLGR